VLGDVRELLEAFPELAEPLGRERREIPVRRARAGFLTGVGVQVRRPIGGGSAHGVSSRLGMATGNARKIMGDLWLEKVAEGRSWREGAGKSCPGFVI
jgi:hypothetical protein